MPLPDTGGLTQKQRDEIDQVYQAAISKGDTQLAQDWLVFANEFWPQHPTYSVQQVLDAFLAVEVGKGLGKGISNVGTLVGSGVPNAAAKAAESLPKVSNPLTAIADFFGALSQANTWIRVAEVVLGVVLLGVGLAHLTGTSNAISKVVGATPVGRVGKVLK